MHVDIPQAHGKLSYPGTSQATSMLKEDSMCRLGNTREACGSLQVADGCSTISLGGLSSANEFCGNWEVSKLFWRCMKSKLCEQGQAED